MGLCEFDYRALLSSFNCTSTVDFTGELHAVASVSTPRSLDFRRGYDGVEWKLKGSSTVKYTVEV
jgi:hypothetical protein